MALLNREAALRALADGKSLETEIEGNWHDMTDGANPITLPRSTWRVKIPEWEKAYEKWCTHNPHDIGEEAGFEAGWNAAMEFKEPKKPQRGSNGLDPYDKNDPLNWGVPIHLR